MVINFRAFLAADDFTYPANDRFSSKNIFLCLCATFPSSQLALGAHHSIRVENIGWDLVNGECKDLGPLQVAAAAGDYPTLL